MIDVRYRQIWFDAVLASVCLTPTVCRVAMALGFSMHVGSGDCYPSYDLLARKAACSRDTAMRAVKTLEAGGWIAIARSRGRKANSFTLLTPAALAVSEEERPKFEPATTPDKTRQLATLQVSRDNAEPDTNGRTAMPPLPLTQRSQAGATVAEMKQSQIELPTVAEPCNPKRIEKIPPYNPPTPEPSNTDAAFEKLWEIWENDADKGRARTAFHRATSTSGLNIPVETIIEAARSRRLRRFASNVPETEPLARWLRGEGWSVAAKRPTLGERQATQPPRPQVFVEEGTPQWRAWNEHRRREGKGVQSAFVHPSAGGRRGWLFESEWPVTMEAHLG